MIFEDGDDAALLSQRRQWYSDAPKTSTRYTNLSCGGYREAPNLIPGSGSSESEHCKSGITDS
jgi:hypothetical protein